MRSLIVIRVTHCHGLPTSKGFSFERTTIFNTVVLDNTAAVLWEEINTLLTKRVIQVVPLLEASTDWYGHYFVVLKRGGELNNGVYMLTCWKVQADSQGTPPVWLQRLKVPWAPFKRGWYTYKWGDFEQWCQESNVLLFQCSIVEILSFPQELSKKSLSFSTIIVYLAAISACHIGFGGLSLGAHPLVAGSRASASLPFCLRGKKSCIICVLCMGYKST